MLFLYFKDSREIVKIITETLPIIITQKNAEKSATVNDTYKKSKGERL